MNLENWESRADEGLLESHLRGGTTDIRIDSSELVDNRLSEEHEGV